MTYKEQLRHPNWQKLRLEVLSKVDFSCEVCGDKESTLNVHHKQYIKGRLAWEYEHSNFEVLCETCHLEAHNAKDVLNAALAEIPCSHWPEAAALLVGWTEKFNVKTEFPSFDPHAELVGKVAASIGATFGVDEITRLIEAIEKWERYDRTFNFHVEKRIATKFSMNDF